MPIHEIEAKVNLGPLFVGRVGGVVETDHTRVSGPAGNLRKAFTVVNPVTIEAIKYNGTTPDEGSKQIFIGSQINEDPNLKKQFFFVDSGAEEDDIRGRWKFFLDLPKELTEDLPEDFNE